VADHHRYPGADRTDVTPPSGGTATSRFTNALGQTTALWSYTTPTPDGVAADARAIAYTYTPAGEKATMTGPAGQVWTYGYDLRGHRIAGTDPDAGSTSATYSAAGDLLTTTDGRNQSLAYTYDVMGRKTAQYAGTDTTGTLLATWSYDTATLGRSRPAASTAYVGGASGVAYTTTVAGYTNRGTATGTSVIIPSNGPADEAPLAGTYGVTTSYNPISGLPASTTYGADGGLPAETVRYSYLQSASMIGMGGNADYFTSAILDPFGRATTVNMGDMPNQVVQRNYYDAATGRLIEQKVDKESASTGPAEDVTTLWNPAGLVTATSDVQDGAASTDLQCYSYNQLGQLVAGWTDNSGIQTAASPSVPNIGGCTTTTPTPSTLHGPATYWQSYTYNNAGNRTTLVDHSLDGNDAFDITHSYSYTGATGTGGQPDAVASITNAGPTGTTTDTYHYDPAGNTTTRSLGASGAPNQTITYDPQGRTQTLTDSVSGNTAGYRYDADGHLLLQRDTQAGATTVVLYLAGEQLTLSTSTGTVSGLRYYPTPGGPTEIRSSTGTLTYEYLNSQGTGEVTIDAGPAQAQTRRYFTPYGQNRGTSPGAWVDNRAFLGKPTDTATGLDLLGARNYDPTTGHFLQRDPIQETGDIGQLGGYTYAADNPVTGSDPTGLSNCVRIEGNDGPCASSLSTPAGQQQLTNYENDQQRQEASWAKYDAELAAERRWWNKFNRRTGEDRIEAAALAQPKEHQQLLDEQKAKQGTCWLGHNSDGTCRGAGSLVHSVGGWVKDHGANWLGAVSVWTGTAAGILTIIPGMEGVAAVLDTVSVVTGLASAAAYALAGDYTSAGAALVGTVTAITLGGIGAVGKVFEREGGTLAKANLDGFVSGGAGGLVEKMAGGAKNYTGMDRTMQGMVALTGDALSIPCYIDAAEWATHTGPYRQGAAPAN
jgi:RHS repeat-associated protein